MTIAPLLESTPALPGTNHPVATLAEARVSFRQPVTDAGFIDAAWWPRTHDLAAELPDLLTLLWSSGREISRITYSLSVWRRAPAQLRIEGRRINLGGFRSSDPLSVRLSDAWGKERIDVLVIPPETDAALAGRALLLASAADGRLRAAEIMAKAKADSA